MKEKGKRRFTKAQLAKRASQRKRFKTMPNLEDYLLDWLDYFKRPTFQLSTYRNFHSYITSHICPVIGDYRLDELTLDIIQLFVDEKLEHGRLNGKGGLSVKTVKEYIMMLRSALNKAIEAQLIQQNPCLGVVFPKENKKEMKVLTIEEQKKLSSIDTEWKPNSNVTVLIGEYAGLRIGEVAGLKMKDINLEKSVISVERSFNRQANFDKNGITYPLRYTSTKNGKSREIPMSEDLKKALTNYINTMPAIYRDNPESPLFMNKRGNALEPRRINYHFAKLLKQHEIKDIHFHSLRHTFATRALEANMNIKTCSILMGHSSIKITQDIYTHVTFDQKLKEIRKMDIHESEDNCN